MKKQIITLIVLSLTGSPLTAAAKKYAFASKDVAACLNQNLVSGGSPTVFSKEDNKLCANLGIGEITFTGKEISDKVEGFRVKGAASNSIPIKPNTKTKIVTIDDSGTTKNGYDFGLPTSKLNFGLVTHTSPASCGATSYAKQAATNLLAGFGKFGELASGSNRTEFYSVCASGLKDDLTSSVFIWTAPDGQENPSNLVVIALKSYIGTAWQQLNIAGFISWWMEQMKSKNTDILKKSITYSQGKSSGNVSEFKDLSALHDIASTILLNLSFDIIQGTISLDSIDFNITYYDFDMYVRFPGNSIPSQFTSVLQGAPTGYALPATTPCTE